MEEKVKKVISEETREKMRKSHLGKKLPIEVREKISKHNGMHKKSVRAKASATLRKSGKVRAEKRKATIQERYPDGLKWTEESNRKRSEALKGKKKSDNTKAKMRHPKYNSTTDMSEVRRLSWKARKLGMTYKEYLNYLKENPNG